MRVRTHTHTENRQKEKQSCLYNWSYHLRSNDMCDYTYVTNKVIGNMWMWWSCQRNIFSLMGMKVYI